MATVNTTQAVTSPMAATSSTPAAPQSAAKQQQNQFLQLLVAQMKGQNPLDPQDGTQFVSQLAQFSSLEELINIRTDLDGISKTSAAATADANAPGTSTNSTVNPFQGVQK